MFFFIKACFQSYGENCRYSCSEHCYNTNCDRFNGSCLVGCTDGFYGELCEKGNNTCFDLWILFEIYKNNMWCIDLIGTDEFA